MLGRTWSKTRALQGSRCKLSSCQEGKQEKNLAMGWSTSGSTPERQAITADKPKPGPQGSLRGIQAETRHSLVKAWARKHSGLLLFGVWVLLMLLYYYYLSASECRPGYTGRGPLGGTGG